MSLETDYNPSPEFQEYYQRGLDILNGSTGRRRTIGKETFSMQLNPRSIRKLLGIEGEFLYLEHNVEDSIGVYDTEMSVGMALLPNGKMICDSSSKSQFLPHFPGERFVFRLGFQESNPNKEVLKGVYWGRATAAIDILTLGKPSPNSGS